MSAIDKFVKNTTYSPDQKYIYRLPPQVFTPGVTVLIGGVEQPKEELEKYDRELLRGYRPDGEPNEPVLSLVNTEEEMQTLLLKVLGIPVAFTLLYLLLGLFGINFWCTSRALGFRAHSIVCRCWGVLYLGSKKEQR